DQSRSLFSPAQSEEAGGLGWDRVGGKAVLWNAGQIGEGLGEFSATQMEACKLKLRGVVPRHEFDHLFVFFDGGIRLILCDQGFGKVAVCDQRFLVKLERSPEQRLGFGIALLTAPNDTQESQC